MTDLRQQTVDTYNNSVEQFVDYFAGIGARTKDINRALELAHKTEGARVVEIGCGDGRDAAEIVERVSEYHGFDIAEKFIETARQKVPKGHFEVADAVNYDFPVDLDIVFAFASLLHLNRSEVATVFSKVYSALRPSGIFYASVKYRNAYQQEVQEDQFGTRLFYYYDTQTLADAAQGFDIVYENQKPIGKTEWLEIAFRKK